MSSFDRRTSPSVVLEVRHVDQFDQPPIAWLLVEEEPFYKHHEAEPERLKEAMLRLHFRRVHPGCADWKVGQFEFTASYVPLLRRISLTGSGAMAGAITLADLGADLKGQHVGTYLMNRMVRWAKQWPDAAVNPITLLASDGQGPNRLRRNRFYEQFGIAFEYEDAEQRGGKSRPMRAAELREVDPQSTWGVNILEVPTLVFAGALLEQKHQVEIEHRILRKAHDEIATEWLYFLRHPVKAMLRTFVRRLWT
ncbi:hypothetical protein [Variovorax paradoxus]|uniref:hypothetical protein n=1 Tax=Variovorax paradoxus TaxID=34073 RepID=UPI0029C697C3|nr:hypothetical protein [Variovorax paradoxus]WPH20798.1 hypothetical protein RZE78_01235 [Variovorax paradoxus]